MNGIPTELSNATVRARPNLYFDGRVVSYGVSCGDGIDRTLGVMLPGVYRFDGQRAQHLTVLAGQCQARLGNVNGWGAWGPCAEGTRFEVPDNTALEIAVASGVLEYMSEFQPEAAPAIGAAAESRSSGES